MKKSTLLGASMTMMGLAIAPAIAQTQGFIQSTTVVGAKIKDSRGEEVGVIKDFVLDRNTGCLVYVVISTGTGGTLSTSTKTVAAPWSVFSASSDPKVYITQFEREKIYGAPLWESTRMEEYSRGDYLSNVYSYYGNRVTLSPPKAASSPSSAKTESVPEKKADDEPAKKSEKASTKTESKSEKSESTSESPSKSSKPKQQHSSEPSSSLEPASTPKEP